MHIWVQMRTKMTCNGWRVWWVFTQKIEIRTPRKNYLFKLKGHSLILMFYILWVLHGGKKGLFSAQFNELILRICAVKQTNNTTGATIDTWTHHIDWYRWFSALGHDTPNRRMMQDRIVVKTQFWAGLRQACSQGSTSSGQWGIDIRYHRCADLCFLLFLISKLPFYRIGS